MISAQANKTIEETEYHQAFIVNADVAGYAFGDDNRPELLLQSFFASTAAYLSRVKISKVDEAVAMVLTDTAGNFKFAAIVEYHENNDNPDEPGNWSFVMTFNESDVTELEAKKTVKKLLYSNEGFKSVFDKVSYDIIGIAFEHSSYMYDACLLIVDTLVQILEREADQNPNEVVDIEVPGYFTASVSVEFGEKVFAVTPDGHLKAIIKDDAALEK
jgi:hypothetical protein